MPNLDLQNKSFPVPEKLVMLAKGNKSLSYSNMKKIKSELDGKQDKDNGDTAMLKWIDDTLGSSIQKAKHPKDLRMKIGAEGTKNSINGTRNNHKIGTAKDTNNKNIGDTPDGTKVATSGREITNNVVNSESYEKEITDILYLIEYMNKT